MPEYIVKPGDTLGAIATRNNVSLAQVIQANPQISSPDLIRVGDKLNLPEPTPSPTEVAAKEADKQPDEEKDGCKEEENCDEEKITVIVELPHSKESGWGAKGLAGHTGMAIGDKYFDYGPDYYQDTLDEKKYDYDFNKDGDKEDIIRRKVPVRDPTFSPGQSWWGKHIARRKKIDIDAVTLSDVEAYLALHWDKNNTNIYGKIYKIEFYVKKSQADKMLKWWQTRYKHLKAYSVYPWTGEQCTTTTKMALQIGGVDISSVTQTPQGMLKDLRSIKSTSVEHKDQSAVIKVLKEEASDWPLKK